MEQNQIVIYQTEDGQTQIDVRMENETVWLTQAQMVELFQTIVRHINNIYKVEEFDRESTCAKTKHATFSHFIFHYTQKSNGVQKSDNCSL